MRRMIKFRYGRARSQAADLYRPAEPGPCAVVVLVHGGFWRAPYDRTLMEPLARDLAGRGFAVWNIGYRRLGERGGGWPGTFEDAAAAVDMLASVPAQHELDLDRVAAVGHAAGGHLALWLAARPGLPSVAPGSGPTLFLRAVVAQAGIADLRAGDADSLGAGACRDLLGGRAADVPDRYALASPRERLPLSVPQLLVHGDADRRVPISQSRTYAEAARAAGDPVELVEFKGMDHGEVVDPAHVSWKAVIDRLPALLAS